MVAHEMSHIRNLDVRLMTIVAALVGAVALLADWARRGMMWGGGPRDETTTVAAAAWLASCSSRCGSWRSCSRRSWRRCWR